MKPIVGMEISSYTSQCVGHIINSTTYFGVISKVNSKSIIVEIGKMVCKKNSEVTYEGNIRNTAKFTFWKFRKDNGKALYKNSLYGYIEM